MNIVKIASSDLSGDGVEILKPGLGSPFHYVSYVIDRVRQQRKKRKSGSR